MLACRVDYTASTGSKATITATYSGDSTHSSSTATFELNGDNGGGDGLQLPAAVTVTSPLLSGIGS